MNWMHQHFHVGERLKAPENKASHDGSERAVHQFQQHSYTHGQTRRPRLAPRPGSPLSLILSLSDYREVNEVDENGSERSGNRGFFRSPIDAKLVNW